MLITSTIDRTIDEIESSYYCDCMTVLATRIRPGTDDHPIESAGLLTLLGVSPSTARLIRYFVVHPESPVHGRQLQRALGLGSASVQRDLERLVAVGALERMRNGRLVQFRPAPMAKVWEALRILVREGTDASDIVRDALSDVSGIDAAFVFGSTARGTARPDSDIDLFVMESPTLDRRALNTQLVYVGVLLNRQVNTVRYSPLALAERLGDAQHAAHRFARELLEGPKRWVSGSVDVLRPLAAAAGIALAGMSTAA